MYAIYPSDSSNLLRLNKYPQESLEELYSILERDFLSDLIDKSPEPKRIIQDIITAWDDSNCYYRRKDTSAPLRFTQVFTYDDIRKRILRYIKTKFQIEFI